MSKQLFIGDTHYGHNGISEKFRQCFSSDEEHHETIHDNICSVSNKRNSLYLMGDIAFKTEQFWRIAEYAKLNEQVFVVLGNHDHHGLWRFCADLDNVTVMGIEKRYRFWLSHAPIHPQELYRAWNIHGHVHNNTVPDARYFNVSCEAVNYAPISLQEIRDVFEHRRQAGLLQPFLTK